MRGWVKAALFVIGGLWPWLAHASSATAAPIDWGQKIAEAALTDRSGDPLSGRNRVWSYQQALYLLGLKQVYDRTGDERLLDHLEQWGRQHVEPDGRIVASPGGEPIVLDTLDSLMPGRVVLVLWQITGDTRYRLAAETIRQRLADWPGTCNGAFWHKDSPKPWSANVIWADGSFMFAPFLVEYSRLFPADANTGRDEAARQLEAYGSLLQDPDSGLLWHAFDQDRYHPWAKQPNPQHAPVIWCRAVGWYGVALVTVLDGLPVNHPYRVPLLNRLTKLMDGYRRYLVPSEGRWRQVMNAPATIETEDGPLTNFTETSCSALHAYVVARAVEEGWLTLAQHRAAALAAQGVVYRLSLDEGRPVLDGAVKGTGIGADQAAYLNPASIVRNDLHGLGAFLLMYESALRRPPPDAIQLQIEAEAGTVRRPMAVLAEADASNGRLVAIPRSPDGPAIDPAGRMLVTVDLPRAGRYRIWGRFLAPSTDANTLRLRIDGKAWWTWDIQPHPTLLRWDSLRIDTGYATPPMLNLAAGRHTIELGYGEGGLRIDALLLTTAKVYAPVGEEQ
ncbi:MAG TPA: glycoside hydrolase family 88 protein [Geminicoccus sp.]|uniref:glycoside hydrolase family 88 protein n=1 Tax=Geminicoccus sp. TaxID=2024832 RepID=UPI002E2EF91F|nr:glycoside hydrolase family 88 protein [Geminicoccus sp.]HEX2528929.1 glycoside hydrolase family 88 protein [Geminicoccus sp.]